jgi:hypothetical protein
MKFQIRYQGFLVKGAHVLLIAAAVAAMGTSCIMVKTTDIRGI